MMASRKLSELMGRLKRAHHVIASMALLGLVASCSPDPACQSACERPFALAEKEARHRATLLQAAPSPWPEKSKAHLERWLQRHAMHRDSFVEECSARCDPDRVACHMRALNVAEWQACGR